MIRSIEPVVAILADRYQFRITQNPQVLRHRSECHVESGGDVAGGQLVCPYQTQNLSSSWLSDNLKGVHSQIYFSRS